MTAQSQSTRRKLSLLRLAEELGNVSKACRLMGYHRDSFYEIRRAFQVGGVDALVEQRRGPRGPHPNRVSPEIEAQILDFCLQRPTYGAQRVANELRLQGHNVSPSGVRNVWLRNELETRTKRLLRLEKTAQESTLVLTEEQIQLLERHSTDFRCRHVEVSAPGELLNQDTFYWGTLKGVGKVYVQVVVDVFCSLAFAKVYNSKMPVTACDLLYDRVMPFYEALGVPVQAVLTDNGREFCGRSESHPYELLLALEGVEHRTTRVRSPRTNGFVERMNRTLLDECFRVAGRTTWYQEVRSSGTSTASSSSTITSGATRATASAAARLHRRSGKLLAGPNYHPFTWSLWRAPTSTATPPKHLPERPGVGQCRNLYNNVSSRVSLRSPRPITT